MIRMLKEEDASACLEIYNYYILNSTATFETEPLTLEEFRNRIKNITERYPWIVLEEKGRIAGYAYLSPFIDRAAYDWTADLAIYLDRSLRGMGYGSELMEGMISLAEKDGYYNLVSVITADNQSSVKLHEKFGFVKSASFEHFGYKNGQWLGVVCYVRKLRDPAEETVSHPLNLQL